MMRRAIFMLVGAALLASPVLANYTAQMTDLPPSWAGGPFQAVLTGTGDYGTQNMTFSTFCLETGVTLSLPGAYTATIDDDVQSGAFGAGNTATQNIFHGSLTRFRGAHTLLTGFTPSHAYNAVIIVYCLRTRCQGKRPGHVEQEATSEEGAAGVGGFV